MIHNKLLQSTSRQCETSLLSFPEFLGVMGASLVSLQIRFNKHDFVWSYALLF